MFLTAIIFVLFFPIFFPILCTYVCIDKGVCTLLSYYRIRKHRKKRRGVDYNAEIPFEKKPAQGTESSATCIFKVLIQDMS